MPQVNKKAYRLDRYSDPARWASYYYQLKLVLSLDPSSILEIGVGDKVFGSYVKNNTDVNYVGADYDPSVSPDVVADVTKLKFADGQFDIACAFEVLEHLPFDRFEIALSELSRVSKRAVIISLPHFGPRIRFNFKIPFIPEIKIACKIPWPRKHMFNGQHYWEIGKKDYSIRRIRSLLCKHFIIKEDFVPFENQYHHFFVLTKII